jgi:methionyl-tRNA formyltransferase
MTGASGTRVVLLTGEDVAHRYVAHTLARRTGLAGIVCVAPLPRSARSKMRTYLRRYGARGIVERSLLRIALQASGENRRRQEELSRLLGAAEFPARVDKATTTGVNTTQTVAALTRMAPDILCVYGTAVVRDQLLSLAPRIALNLHTGISPRYRGADCAFWPLHNREPEWIGATVHECTSAIDGGSIFGVRRASLEGDEGVAGIFARAVIAGASLYSEVVNDVLTGRALAQPQDLTQGREYRAANRDWHAELRVHRELRSGLLRRRHASG